MVMTTKATRQRTIDGKPLYAYKWLDREYNQIKEQVRAQIPNALRGMEEYSFSSMFCIYAAETFRRRHESGPWMWETIFSEIGYPTPDYQLIYIWVARGLKHFKRTLLKSHRGDRQFLITLACEGGLPLRLLHRESAHLSRYFRELLTAYHRERHRPECDASEMARQVAARYLPGSLRHEVVFQLSGDLIQSVVKLQERVVEASDPIASLDSMQPQWRDELPLPVEDDTVETLLRNLVGQAKNLAQTERQRWRWRCFLVRQGEHWNIEQLLELPRIVTGASLQAWSGWPDPPARLRVLLQTTEEVELIAILTRLQGVGEQAIYHCEGLCPHGVRLVGSLATAGTRLLLSQGNEEIELPMVGGQEFGPLPWVFAERGAQWEWCGEGSVRSRDASLRVLALAAKRSLAAEATCEPLGEAPELQRSLFQITGTVEWRHSDLGDCRIQCASQEVSEAHFLLRGNRLLSVLNVNPPFLGMPSLLAIGSDEVTRRIAHGVLEWRPLNAPEGNWRRDAAVCAGRVWLRYRDASGALRFRRQSEVAPSTTRVDMVRIGAGTDTAGIIRLTGLAGARVIVPDVEHCRFQTRSIENGVEIVCFAQASLPVMQFQANLQWSDGRSLALMLPFPRKMAVFVRAGQALLPNERVALDRLAAIQAVARTPFGGRRLRLEGRIKTSRLGYYRQEMREWLHASGNEPVQFALHHVQERLASMLALAGDLDAVVLLEIVDWDSHALAQLEVALFDVVLEPDREYHRVVLPPASQNRFSDGEETNITVKMLPLWDPAIEATELVRDDTTLSWSLPQTIEPGPWWVLGYDGNWPRFRPLLWVVDGEPNLVEAGALTQAILERNHQARQDKFQMLAQTLAEDTEHPDWPRVFDYLQLTRPYPASAFDLFRHLVKTPEAMVLALLNSSDDEFELVWSLAEKLPFAWHLVSVSSWLQAAERHFNSLRDGLSGHEPDGALVHGMFGDFRQRVTSHQPFFRSVCDWIGERLFPDQPMAGSELKLARHGASVLIGLIQQHQQALQARHGADERYPDGPNVMQQAILPDFLRPLQLQFDRLSPPFRPVRYAPFVAAQISLDAQDYPEALWFELRQLREFDCEWFDNAFASALCLGLARRPVVTEGTQS
jgi:hypothetical protein